MTVDRLKKIPTVKEIFIVTGEELAETVKAEVKGIKAENVIVEPSGKNTAPCIGLAATRICLQDKNCIMGVFPADHLVVGHRDFEKALRTASHIARKRHSLVTIGIEPTYPATGYGYIQYDVNSEDDHLDAYRVKTFAEKPHRELAERFLESGDFLWNSGMFIWETGTLLKEMQRHMPDLFHSLELMKKRFKKDINASVADLWKNIAPDSIDYGLLEKSENIHVIQAKYDWSDVGSWKAAFDLSSKKSGNNVIKGDGAILNGQDNFIQSEGRFTAVVGADNLVVVNTEDATLVIPKDKVESVKELVEYLQKTDRKELL